MLYQAGNKNLPVIAEILIVIRKGFIKELQETNKIERREKNLDYRLPEKIDSE
ncbi:MAG: hypothetical protein JXA44_02050 [Methanospirillaceae archaeon]|nr:hypothetical protein [Methanospirillaceae archaeon]